MCELAPDGKRCIYDGFHRISCEVHTLNFEHRELWRARRVIGKNFKPYICPDFTERSAEIKA